MPGSCCFIVFSEAYPPRQFALYSLRETHSTKEDIKTSVELRRYLGTLLLSEEPWVTNYLYGRQPYKWLDSDFAHGVNALVPSMKFGVEPYLTHYQPLYNNKACHVKYSFPATAAFQFGGDRRLLVACAIVDKNTDQTQCVSPLALTSLPLPLHFRSKTYRFGADGRLQITQLNNL